MSWRRGALAVAMLSAMACRGDTQAQDTPPTVPRMPQVERLELGRFLISWPPSEDDHTPSDQIRYEIGRVAVDFCVVREADYELTGRTELETQIPNFRQTGPLIGFTVRSIDLLGQSYGYGPCGWALRSPQRAPIADIGRIPDFGSATADSAPLDCRSDGGRGAWCRAGGEVAHFGAGRWDVFPLPAAFEIVDWVPLDDADALVRSDTVQLQLSRANGIHTYVLGPGNQFFDGRGGAIHTGRERAYLSVRGGAGEFSAGRLDVAGPARALRLPDECERVEQMGSREELAFALCRVRESLRLFLGTNEGRLMRWGDPFEVAGNRVASFTGNEVGGLLAMTEEAGATLYRWSPDGLTEIATEGLPGTGVPEVAIAGDALSQFALIGRGGHFTAYDGARFVAVEEAGDDAVWHSVRFPRSSRLVGTRHGVLAISPERVVWVDGESADLLWESPGPARGVRGRDGRYYILRTGPVDSIPSTADGVSWYRHPWRRGALEPVGMAVSPSGAIYFSGSTDDPSSGPEQRRVVVGRLGEDDGELAASNPPQFVLPPLLAVDDLGRLYTYSAGVLRLYIPATEAWEPAIPIPAGVHRLLALEDTALLVGTQQGDSALFRCSGSQCFEIDVPAAANHPFDAAFAHGDGFCLGVRSRALWCREGQQDTWIPLNFASPIQERYDLSPTADWRVLDAVARDGAWLVAIRTEGGAGFLASVSRGEPARLVAEGLDWGEGDLLLPPTEDGSQVVIERSGPVRLWLSGQRVSVPGILY